MNRKDDRIERAIERLTSEHLTRILAACDSELYKQVCTYRSTFHPPFFCALSGGLIAVLPRIHREIGSGVKSKRNAMHATLLRNSRYRYDRGYTSSRFRPSIAVHVRIFPRQFFFHRRFTYTFPIIWVLKQAENEIQSHYLSYSVFYNDIGVCKLSFFRLAPLSLSFGFSFRVFIRGYIFFVFLIYICRIELTSKESRVLAKIGAMALQIRSLRVNDIPQSVPTWNKTNTTKYLRAVFLLRETPSNMNENFEFHCRVEAFFLPTLCTLALYLPFPPVQL